MNCFATVFYAKFENGFQRLLSKLKEYPENQKREAFYNLESELDARFFTRQVTIFDTCNEKLIDKIIVDAENILFSKDVYINTHDLPTYCSFYWIFATLLFDLKYKDINKDVIIPCFAGTSFGEFWAVTMACRKDHFSDKECIWMAYEYGRILAATQINKSENKKLANELTASFASKYFSDYLSTPMCTFPKNKTTIITLDNLNNLSTFITHRKTDSLVEVIAQSFFDSSEESALQNIIIEKMACFIAYEIIKI